MTDPITTLEAELRHGPWVLQATAKAVLVRVKELEEALREIADEESGWRFKRDPLEHARSVIEEMREKAARALTEPTREEGE